MHVRSLLLRSFMGHREAKLVLPERGILTITGPNESGKSSYIEAVAYGLWGKTLRGTDPWAGDVGEVVVETDLVVVQRTRDKKKVNLNWRLNDEHALDPEDYATTTKAQEALERIIGTFDVWRRTSVFSSADAAHFTLATDGERKRLLESLLDLTQFDAGLEQCRAALKQSREVADKHRHALEVLEERLRGAQQRADDAAKMLDKHGITPDASTEHDEGEGREALALVERRIREGEALLRKLNADGQAMGAELARAKAVLRQAKQRHDLLIGGRCPTCEQTIPDALAKSLVDAVSDATAQAEALERKAREEMERVDAERAEVMEEQRAFGARRDKLRSVLQEYERGRQLQVDYAAIIQEARDDIATTTRARDATMHKLDIADRTSRTLEACEQVLGLKGVRVQLLARALIGLEQAANVYFARVVGAGRALRLRPYTEKKSGGVADSISFEAQDAGGVWRPYRATSGGARRRADVALLFALAEIAAGARGSRPGTLFFDEPFDTLDPEGTEAVAGVLEELARERGIVVITHAQDLADRLPGQHLRLDGRAAAS